MTDLHEADTESSAPTRRWQPWLIVALVVLVLVALVGAFGIRKRHDIAATTSCCGATPTPGAVLDGFKIGTQPSSEARRSATACAQTNWSISLTATLRDPARLTYVRLCDPSTPSHVDLTRTSNNAAEFAALAKTLMAADDTSVLATCRGRVTPFSGTLVEIEGNFYALKAPITGCGETQPEVIRALAALRATMKGFPLGGS